MAGPTVEQMTGAALLGVRFESGHVLACRSVRSSSVGPPYRSVWHRDPQGRWTIHANVLADRACSRYFGPALHANHVDDVEVRWRGGTELYVTVARARLHLAIRLAATPFTRALGLACRVAPGQLWHSRTTGLLAGRALRAGRLTFAGLTPSGHQFSIRPRAFWRVAAAAAVLDGRDAGSLTVAPDQPALGGFLIPARGLFASGRFEFLPAEDLP